MIVLAGKSIGTVLKKSAFKPEGFQSLSKTKKALVYNKPLQKRTKVINLFFEVCH
jgi:hypothetical protein